MHHVLGIVAHGNCRVAVNFAPFSFKMETSEKVPIFNFLQQRLVASHFQQHQSIRKVLVSRKDGSCIMFLMV
jgi:hypothetical protein